MQQQMVDEAGNIWNVDAAGNPVSFAGRQDAPSQGVQIKPADLDRGIDTELKRARLNELQGGGPNSELQRALLAAQVAKAQADAAKAQQGTAGAEAGDIKTNQRIANLRALEANIARVRELYRQNLQGGFPNALSGRVPGIIRPENEQFNSAGAGLGETGLAAFRVPGVGAQSDAELRAFIQANQPVASDSDLAIEEKLRNLETRLNATLSELGMAPAQQQEEQDPFAAVSGGQPGGPTGSTPTDGGPPMLNRAAGASRVAGPEIAGATSEGGYRIDPSLSSLPAEVMRGIENGASTQEIISYINERRAPLGFPVSAEQAAAIGAVVARKRANPRAPTSSLGNFDALALIPGGPQTTMGAIADTPVGNFTMNAANAATAGIPAALAGEQGTAVMEAARQGRPVSSMAGDITGSIAGMMGAQRGIGALGRVGNAVANRGGGIATDAAFGALRGYNEDGVGGAITGGLAAGLGNAGGQAIVKGGASALRGVRDPAVNYLASRNIPMTAGQLLGNRGVFGRTMNKLESLPILGDVMQTRRMEGIEAFNRAAMDDAVAPIGGTSRGIGEDAIGRAQSQVSDAYTGALAGRALTPDEAYSAALAERMAAGRQVPTLGDEFGYLADKNIAPLVSGQMDGPAFQAALQNIKGARSQYAKQGAMGNEIADITRGMEDDLIGLANRQAPDIMPALSRANQANRNVSVLEDAAMSNADRVFTPAQLMRAATANTKKYGGKKAAARGDTPFRDLTRAGQEVLPPTIPNSGTADRGFASIALPAALGGTAYGVGEYTNPVIAAPLAVLAALSTKTGTKAAQKALTGRSPAMKVAGRKLAKQSRKAGIFGAAMVPALTQ